MPRDINDIITDGFNNKLISKNEKKIFNNWLTSSFKKSRGLGDTIKKMTEKFKIPQCKSCKKRQEKLNKLFPYDNRKNK